jgi:hypothetical protein
MIPEISANVATFNKFNALQNPYNIKVARHFVSLFPLNLMFLI